MSSRPKNPKYARNKNILVIGGSGSGKTRFFVKPSLMQKELAEKIKKLRSEIEKQSSQAMTTDMFISLVRKYTRARKLTR